MAQFEPITLGWYLHVVRPRSRTRLSENVLSKLGRITLPLSYTWIIRHAYGLHSLSIADLNEVYPQGLTNCLPSR